VSTQLRGVILFSAPHSFHETLRRELFNKHTPVRIETARAALDDYRFRETSASLVTTWIGKAVAPVRWAKRTGNQRCGVRASEKARSNELEAVSSTHSEASTIFQSLPSSPVGVKFPVIA
jgi:hypothetical protein